MPAFSASDEEIQKQIAQKDAAVNEVVRSESKLRDLLGQVGSYLAKNSSRIGGGLQTSLGTLTRLLGSYLSGKYRDLPVSTLSLIAFGLLYFISPIDLIPDALIPFGFADDAFVLAWVVQRITGELTKFRSWERAEAYEATFRKIPFEEVRQLILIGGWFSKTADYSEHLAIMRRLYPNAEAEHFRWEANAMWETARNEADHAAPATLLKRLESVDLSKTVLIGHSLGGRIAVRVLSQLESPLHHAIFMGAAIDADDPAIPEAVLKVRNDIFNLYSQADGVLRYLYQGYHRKKPLGLTGSEKDIPGFLNIMVSGNEEHYYGLVENIASIQSLLRSKIPLRKQQFSPGMLESFGNLNRHQFLEYIRFLEKPFA